MSSNDVNDDKIKALFQISQIHIFFELKLFLFNLIRI